MTWFVGSLSCYCFEGLKYKRDKAYYENDCETLPVKKANYGRLALIEGGLILTALLGVVEGSIRFLIGALVLGSSYLFLIRKSQFKGKVVRLCGKALIASGVISFLTIPVSIVSLRYNLKLRRMSRITLFTAVWQSGPREIYAFLRCKHKGFEACYRLFIDTTFKCKRRIKVENLWPNSCLNSRFRLI